MPRNEPRPVSIELLREPASPDRLAAEVVTLGRQPGGDLALHAHATGAAVELIMGDGLIDSVCSWTVAADQVPAVLAAAVRDLFPGKPAALREWMAARGIPATHEAWRGYAVRPVDEDRFLLEVLRVLIGTVERDEGQKIAGRLTDWLTRSGISYEFDEWAGEAH